MSSEVAGVMQDARDNDDIGWAAPIEQKVSRGAYPRLGDTHSAEGKMVGANAFRHELGPLRRSRPFGIIGNIAHCLKNQRLIA